MGHPERKGRARVGRLTILRVPWIRGSLDMSPSNSRVSSLDAEPVLGRRRLALLAIACAACAPLEEATFPSDPSLRSFLLVARQTDVGSLPIAAYAFLPPPRAVLAGLGAEATVVLLG